jgi:hypothetical protein
MNDLMYAIPSENDTTDFLVSADYVKERLDRYSGAHHAHEMRA